MQTQSAENELSIMSMNLFIISIEEVLARRVV